MNVLVINSGSSSIKYQLFDMTERRVLASGLLEQIGEAAGHLRHSTHREDGVRQDLMQTEPVADHAEGFDRIMAAFSETGTLTEADGLSAIGHRVVHGGEAFQEPTLIDREVIETIREQIPLAPLHNPANLTGIEVTFSRRPYTPQVAVFDTAFHQTIPPQAYNYALPHALAESLGVRRYGFHGTSHQFVAKAAARHLGIVLGELNLITCHLGNGASICAVGPNPDLLKPRSPLSVKTLATSARRPTTAKATVLAPIASSKV